MPEYADRKWMNAEAMLSIVSLFRANPLPQGPHDLRGFLLFRVPQLKPESW
jgi:hypothetical protein